MTLAFFAQLVTVGEGIIIILLVGVLLKQGRVIRIINRLRADDK